VKKQFAALGAILLCVAAVAAGCGSSSSSSSSSGGSSSGASAPVSSGGTVTPAQAANPKGSVTWCIGKDTTGAFSQVVGLYNQAHPGVHVKLLELPTSADQQRTQLTQRLQAKSPECDVLGMDVIWTAEFASQGWLKDVSPAIQARQNEFIPSTLNTVKINNKYWAVPFNTNAGLIYYNTKKVQQAPTTWQQVFQMAKADGGFGFQGQSYEGLTVDFLEMLYSDGGSVLSSDGKKATLDSPQAQQVLSTLQQGFKDKAIPQANLTYMEEDSRNAFQTGRVSILRNWPYVYALAKQAHVPFKVVPLPTWAGGKAASVLGGYNLGISTYSKNPGGALSFINYATGPAAQKKFFIKSSLPAVLTGVYTDPAVVKSQPFAPQLLKAVQNGVPRPVSPVYPQISEAIQKNVYSALSNGTSPSSALSTAQNQINAALKTF
jgi:multiple sugar transport system substrate-binding protein